MRSRVAKYSKFFLALLLCLLARLIPVRVPNVEPILATDMPFAAAYGALAGVSFAVFSIVLYDLLTHTLGVQTFFTASAYGILGFAAAKYFSAGGGSALSGKNIHTFDYVKFAIAGTLFYDAATGLTVGPLFFHETFVQAFLGQIPFTLLHLFGNITFAFILSPAVYKFLNRKRVKEKSASTVSTLTPTLI